MLAYKLRHRVIIEELLVFINSDDGSQDEMWAAIDSKVPASINPLSGKEFIAAAGNQSQINTRIIIRNRNDLKASMRILHEGVIYNIKAIIPDPTLRHHVTLLCESGVNDG
jgi:SPP1 family predicted phage head-tail adaptor